MQTIITDYGSKKAVIRKIRDQVFVLEQSVPREEEIDERDILCTHALVYISGRPLGTGRLDSEKDGKIGRMAVLQEARRQGIGSAILIALEDEARNRALPRLWCHAQEHAVGFYEKHGFRVTSGPFEEAQIWHVAMEKLL